MTDETRDLLRRATTLISALESVALGSRTAAELRKVHRACGDDSVSAFLEDVAALNAPRVVHLDQEDTDHG